MANGYLGGRPVVGARVGGVAKFFPGYTKPNGEVIEDRCTLTVVVNQRGAKDKVTGIRRDGKKENIPLTFWGAGARNAAISGCPGKEFKFLEVRAESYDGPVYDPHDGSRAVSKNGQAMTTKKIGNGVGTYIWGDDSEKRIAFEIAQGLRPPCWDGKIPLAIALSLNGTGGAQAVVDYAGAHINDPEIWKQMLAQRNAAVYTPGMPIFGVAEVVAPVTGAVPAAYQAPVYQAPVSQVPPMPPVTGAPTVDNFTLAQYLGAGWTEVTLRANPKYAPLFVVATVPAPPAVPTPPVADPLAQAPVQQAFSAEKAI